MMKLLPPPTADEAREHWKAIFSSWESPDQLAEDLRRPYATVNSWIVRGRIPSEYWYDLVIAARRRKIAGVTYEKLVWLDAAKRKPDLIKPASEYASRKRGDEQAAA